MEKIVKEESLLNQIIPLLKQSKDVVVGPGDDCAAIDIGNPEKILLFAVDQLISNVHYDPAVTTPKQSGAKLIKRNISDIAAMGGIPSHALLTIASNSINTKWLKNFYRGITQEAESWNISICGGDISRINKKDITVCTLSILGFVNKKNLCLRKNAKPGDLLFATGKFGDSYNSKHHLEFIPRINEGTFLAGYYTNAMIDVSDGLLIDTQHMAKESNVTIQLNLKSIPVRGKSLPIKNILTDGEDYELIFCVSPKKEKALLSKWPFDTKLTKIGKLLPCRYSSVIDEKGKDLIQQFKNTGFSHF